MEIIKSSKKAGIHTNKIDPEPYFFRWQSCIPMGSKDQPELVGQPCYQHKTCRHLVKIAHDRIPPKVCPWCHVDTVKEAKQIEIAEKQGIKIFDGPEKKIVPKNLTADDADQLIDDFS